MKVSQVNLQFQVRNNPVHSELSKCSTNNQESRICCPALPGSLYSQPAVLRYGLHRRCPNRKLE